MPDAAGCPTHVLLGARPGALFACSFPRIARLSLRVLLTPETRQDSLQRSSSLRDRSKVALATEVAAVQAFPDQCAVRVKLSHTMLLFRAAAPC
jgi:hypothetical protein